MNVEVDYIIYNPEKKQYATYVHSEHNSGWFWTDNPIDAYASIDEDDTRRWITGFILPSGRVLRKPEPDLQGSVVMKRSLIVSVEPV